MVNCSADIPLCVSFQNGSAGDDHTQHSMDIFNAGFLVAPHRITIKEACSGIPAAVFFQMVRLPEFPASVGEDHREKE